MRDGLTHVRAALDDYRLAGPAYAEYPAWKVGLAKRLIDSIMFTGEGMAAYLCSDGSVLLTNELGLAVHDEEVVLPLYELFIEWGFPREVFYTPLHAVMEWLDCDEEEAIAVTEQLDLEDLALLTRLDYDDWVAYAAGHIPAEFIGVMDVVRAGQAVRDQHEYEAGADEEEPPDAEMY